MLKKIVFSSFSFFCLFLLSNIAQSEDVAMPEWLADLESMSSTKMEMDGIEYTLALSETELSHKVIMCLVAPCPDGTAFLNAAFIMKNISDAPQTLSFPNSNLVSLEVRNAESHVVLSSDDGAMFTMAIEEITLQPGESRVMPYGMLLQTATGENIVGEFSVVAVVRSYDNPIEMATGIKVMDRTL